MEAALVLCRLAAVGGNPVCFRIPAEIPGLGCALPPAALVAGLVVCLLSGSGWTILPTTVGRTNMPCPGSQSKYRSPWTAPSFLPVASSNSRPIHCPSAKWVVPMKRTVACRPSGSSITVPTDKAWPGILNRFKSYNELLSDNREVLVVERTETRQLLSPAERVK